MSSTTTNHKRRSTLRVETLEPREVPSANPITQDSNDTWWVSYHDQTTAQFDSSFNSLKASYVPTDIEVDDVSGSSRLSSSWERNADGRQWYLWYGLTSTQFGDKWTQYRDAGFRVADQETYTINGQVLYAGIWVKNTEGVAWASNRNMSATSYQEKFNTYSANYIPVDIDIDNINGSLYYSTVFARNTSGVQWVAKHGLTASAYETLFNQMKATHRVTDFESYTFNGQQYYAVVWVRNTNNRWWSAWRDMSEQTYWNKFNYMNDMGYRLVDTERYMTPSGWRYASVWRQNGDRPNWSLRSNVDTLMSTHRTTYDTPGLSVAVVQNGKFLYRRGTGFQDKNAGVEYSASTINRLASISKAVGGVLSMDLVERGLLDINRTTRSYVGTMPAHHTHTLRQLLSNRGGAGHYSQWGDYSANYATALAASQAMWSKSLQYTPGQGYLYSTHGYTLLGAGIEAAMGKSITRVVNEDLTSRYALGTLRVEDRSVSNRYRTQVHNSSNTVTTADNTSWKILGGGLESSVVDLANFGVKTLNGTILSSTSRTTMWTAPDTRAAYGLGWDLGSTSGKRWVAKSGGQLGASTYLLMYPDQGIVVAVMSNRQNNNPTGTLAHNIGKLLIS